MASKVSTDSPKNFVILFGVQQSVPHQNQLIEEETEKKATQTVYARLKQVSLFSSVI